MVNDEKENEEQVIKSPKVAVNDSEDAQIQPACEPPPPSQSTAREPSPIALNAPAEMSEDSSGAEDIPPKVVPRRRSAEPKLQNDVTCTSNVVTSPSPNSESAIHPDWSEPSLTSARSESDLPEEQKISVKERKQMFNRMASEGDMLQSHKLSFNTTVSVWHTNISAGLKPTVETIRITYVLCFQKILVYVGYTESL